MRSKITPRAHTESIQQAWSRLQVAKSTLEEVKLNALIIYQQSGFAPEQIQAANQKLLQNGALAPEQYAAYENGLKQLGVGFRQ